MFAKPEDLSVPDKKDILLATLKGYEDHLLHLSGQSAKISIAISSGLIVLPLLVADHIASISIFVAISLSVAIGVIVLISISAILNYSRHYSWLCRAITRVKQALGLFEEGVYLSFEALKKGKYEWWFEDTSILPAESQGWGSGFDMSANLSYIVAIVVAFIASMLMIWTQVNVS